MHFTKHLSLLSLALTFTAASPAAQPNPKALQSRENNKGIFINPWEPKLSLDEQCIWREANAPVARQWNIVVNDAKDFTDDTCGSGFLDNLHGRGCAVTGWGCNYANDGKTMNAAFNTQTTCGDTDVGNAIKAAFGGTELVCADYEKHVECDEDDSCYISKPRGDIWG